MCIPHLRPVTASLLTVLTQSVSLARSPSPPCSAFLLLKVGVPDAVRAPPAPGGRRPRRGTARDQLGSLRLLLVSCDRPAPRVAGGERRPYSLRYHLAPQRGPRARTEHLTSSTPAVARWATSSTRGRRFLLDLEGRFTFENASLVPAGGGPNATRRHGATASLSVVDGSSRSLAVFDLCGGLDGFFAVKHFALHPAAAAARSLGRGGGRAHPTGTGYWSTRLPPARVLALRLCLLAPTARPTRPASARERPAPPPGRTLGSGPAPGQSAPRPAGVRDHGRGGGGAAPSRARQVELLLVAGNIHGGMPGRGLQPTSALASIANKLWHSHASIENHIRLVVVRWWCWAAGPEHQVRAEPATTLKNFCKWQHQHNQLGDDHEGTMTRPSCLLGGKSRLGEWFKPCSKEVGQMERPCWRLLSPTVPPGPDKVC